MRKKPTPLADRFETDTSEQGKMPRSLLRALSKSALPTYTRMPSLLGSSAAASDPATLRDAGLARVGDLKLHTGNKLIDQWHTKFYSQIMLFVLLQMVSGPDYNPDPDKR